MGKMGRAIDALPDDVKDYMVRSQRWVSGMDADVPEDGGGPDLDTLLKCPAMHVAAAMGAELAPLNPLDVHHATGRGGGTHSIQFKTREDFETYAAHPICDIGPHYDRLCERFGQRRIVRLIKQRAAATMSGEVEAPEREAVPAHASTQEV